MNMTTFTTLILLSVFSSISQAGKILTEDCVARYNSESGKLVIPCLLYREADTSVNIRTLWAAHFVRVPTLVVEGMLFELTQFAEAHLRYEDIDFFNPSAPPPGSVVEPWQPTGITHSDCVARYQQGTGRLTIPCLKYWETTRSSAYPQILDVGLGHVPLLAENPLLLEVRGIRHSFIQHEDFTVNDNESFIEAE